MIVIRLLSQAGGLPAMPLEARFGDAGGDIGRAADCTLVLPDPERRISRKHLQVACRSGRYFLRLISNNLPVELDGLPLAAGVECVLELGAKVRIGPFLLGVAEASAPALPASPAPALPASASAIDDELALLGAPRSNVGPSVFHDLLHAPPLDPRSAAALEIDLLVGEPTGSSPRVASPPAVMPRGGDVPAFEPLFAGLGLSAPEPAARSAAQMRLVGELLRASIAGTLGLLAARGIAKHELGASPTLFQSQQNNPLKFATDVDQALAQLIEPPRRGFLPAVVAVRETFDDLRAHEIAMLAGMRAALEAVLQRFDPVALEQRWADKGLWDNLRPANHKAKLWERYAEQHAELVREIEDNFDSTFAGAFGAAYEAQLARLTRAV
jgi:predicted component of type VI protein secretion system